MSSAFIVASLITHLPQRDDIARDAQATKPDLGPGRARSNIVGYIFGVTPGLIIWIVFGFTTAYRKIMCERLVPDWLRRKKPQSQPQHPWAGSTHNPSFSTMLMSKPPQAGLDIELQTGDFNRFDLSHKEANNEVISAPRLQVHGPASLQESKSCRRKSMARWSKGSPPRTVGEEGIPILETS